MVGAQEPELPFLFLRKRGLRPGTWLQNTAQVLLAYRLAHSVLAVGNGHLRAVFEPAVLGPWAGVMADRFGGRRTLLGTQMVSGLIATTLAGLEFGGMLNETGRQRRHPQRPLLHLRLARAQRHGAATGGRGGLRPAFAMDSVSYNMGRAVAPLLRIAVVHWSGYGWAFAGNAVSFVFFTLMLWRARQHGSDEQPQRSRVWPGSRARAMAPS